MSSLPHSQQTNRHLDARLSRIENAPKFKVQGHMAQHLEWNSLLQNYRRILRPAEQRQITIAHKIVYTSKSQGRKYFKFTSKSGQVTQNTKALASKSNKF